MINRIAAVIVFLLISGCSGEGMDAQEPMPIIDNTPTSERWIADASSYQQAAYNEGKVWVCGVALFNANGYYTGQKYPGEYIFALSINPEALQMTIYTNTQPAGMVAFERTYVNTDVSQEAVDVNNGSWYFFEPVDRGIWAGENIIRRRFAVGGSIHIKHGETRYNCRAVEYSMAQIGGDLISEQ